MLILTLVSLLSSSLYFHLDVVFAFGLAAVELLRHPLAFSLAPLADGDPLAAIGKKVTEITTSAKAIGRPIAILSLLLLGLSWLASGVNQEWSASMKGVMLKIFMGGILLGIAPDVVGIFFPADVAAAVPAVVTQK